MRLSSVCSRERSPQTDNPPPRISTFLFRQQGVEIFYYPSLLHAIVYLLSPIVSHVLLSVSSSRVFVPSHAVVTARERDKRLPVSVLLPHASP